MRQSDSRGGGLQRAEGLGPRKQSEKREETGKRGQLGTERVGWAPGVGTGDRHGWRRGSFWIPKPGEIAAYSPRVTGYANERSSEPNQSLTLGQDEVTLVTMSVPFGPSCHSFPIP